jgi:DNA-directed RNA polymerase subunit alpha
MQDTQHIPALHPRFKTSESSVTGHQAVVVMEPLEQGYGHTLGNALRRVLLSSLPGFAVTSIRIEGVDHQFTTLEGMQQDILEFVLNVKQIRIKSASTQPATLRLSVKGAKTVTAGDIDCPGGIEIMNKDLVLANVAANKSLVVEFTAEAGTGYSFAQDRRSEVLGEIPVDALFSPITTVSYTVGSTRVGRRTDFDKLEMTILTDGTQSALEAVENAARILVKQFTQIVEPEIATEDKPLAPVSSEEQEVLKLSVEELDLPTRIANSLKKGGFKTVGDLIGVPKDTISKVKNLGGKSVDLIDEALQKRGLRLS